MEHQTIYFDPDHAELDNGYGWNVINSNEDIGIAARFDSLASAKNWCELNGFTYTILPERKTMLHIYYDSTYDDTHLGWKVSDPDKGVLARFTNHKDAIRYCETNGFDYKLLVEECYEEDDIDWTIRFIPGVQGDE